MTNTEITTEVTTENSAALFAENVTNDQLKMTSMEIAQLVEKRHDNVKRTVETLVKQGVIIRPQIEDEQNTDAMGRERTTQVYVFSGEQGKRDSIIVVAQLSPEFTARLVDRWQELEKKLKSPPDLMEALNDPTFLRNTLASYSEKVIKLQNTVHQMQPKAAGYDRIALPSSGSLPITDAAKALQINPKKLFTWLQCNGWIYRRAGGKNWLGYQDKIKQQLLEHKITMIARSDGSEKMTEQVLLTSKGISKLSSTGGIDR